MRKAGLRAILALVLLPIAMPAAWAWDATPNVVAGYDAYNRGDFQTALRLLTPEALRGNSDALMGLNYMYVRGDGVPTNPVLAADYARRAAEKGNPEGKMALGYKYWLGVGVPRDLRRAVELTCEAIAFGNPRAMNNLAIMHHNGDYVVRSEAEARFLWQQSAERGHPNAEANLGISYMLTEERDLEQARFWLRRAAAHGVERARVALAQLGETWPLTSGVDGGDKIVIYPKGAPAGLEHACGVPATS